MIKTRTATDADFLNLLNLIIKINEKEKEYLRYNQDPHSVVNRLAKNIIEGHVILFTDDDQIFGFIEYSIIDNLKIWVYSLYYSETYRKKTYSTLLPAFKKLKEDYRLPIHYAVMLNNRTMLAISKFIKAKPILRYPDGRVEMKVEVH